MTSGDEDMFKVTLCRTCHSDVYVDSDGDGAYLRCAECGFICNLVEPVPRLRGLHASYVADSVKETPALLALVPA